MFTNLYKNYFKYFFSFHPHEKIISLNSSKPVFVQMPQLPLQLDLGYQSCQNRVIQDLVVIFIGYNWDNYNQNLFTYLLFFKCTSLLGKDFFTQNTPVLFYLFRVNVLNIMKFYMGLHYILNLKTRQLRLIIFKINSFYHLVCHLYFCQLKNCFCLLYLDY